MRAVRKLGHDKWQMIFQCHIAADPLSVTCDKLLDDPWSSRSFGQTQHSLNWTTWCPTRGTIKFGNSRWLATLWVDGPGLEFWSNKLIFLVFSVSIGFTKLCKFIYPTLRIFCFREHILREIKCPSSLGDGFESLCEQSNVGCFNFDTGEKGQPKRDWKKRPPIYLTLQSFVRCLINIRMKTFVLPLQESVFPLEDFSRCNWLRPEQKNKLAVKFFSSGCEIISRNVKHPWRCRRVSMSARVAQLVSTPAMKPAVLGSNPGASKYSYALGIFLFYWQKHLKIWRTLPKYLKNVVTVHGHIRSNLGASVLLCYTGTSVLRLNHLGS